MFGDNSGCAFFGAQLRVRTFYFIIFKGDITMFGYDNIGDKIKSLAKVAAILGAIACIIEGLFKLEDTTIWAD